mgnify:CR=1 FL=1
MRRMPRKSRLAQYRAKGSRNPIQPSRSRVLALTGRPHVLLWPCELIVSSLCQFRQQLECGLPGPVVSLPSAGGANFGYLEKRQYDLTIPTNQGNDGMNAAKTMEDVSIRFTLTLDNGLSATGRITGDRLDFTPGEGEVMPALEEALKGALKGERRQLTLSAEDDPNLLLDVTRLARVLGHPGETLTLEVEIL